MLGVIPSRVLEPVVTRRSLVRGALLELFTIGEFCVHLAGDVGSVVVSKTLSDAREVVDDVDSQGSKLLGGPDT